MGNETDARRERKRAPKTQGEVILTQPSDFFECSFSNFVLRKHKTKKHM